MTRGAALKILVAGNCESGHDVRIIGHNLRLPQLLTCWNRKGAAGAGGVRRDDGVGGLSAGSPAVCRLFLAAFALCGSADRGLSIAPVLDSKRSFVALDGRCLAVFAVLGLHTFPGFLFESYLAVDFSSTKWFCPRARLWTTLRAEMTTLDFMKSA